VAERELIRKIRERYHRVDSMLFAGIGDDCALFGNTASNPWMITTDMLVDNVHFNLNWHDPYRLGRKSIAANISDIAAMGGIPKFILLTFCFPPAVKDEWLEQFLGGIGDMCSEYGCAVIGGDTVSGNELSFSVTVVGTSAGVSPVKRSGALAGDIVFVSGCLGSAALGLKLFQAGMSVEELTLFHLAHLDPSPQVKLGRRLAEGKLVSAMQDLSDGIATDLAHICHESGVGAILDENLLPMEENFSEYCNALQLDPTAIQLKGGEEYQLVFTVPADKETSLHGLRKEGFSLYRIGEIQEGQGVRLQRKNGRIEDISYQGYEHT